MHVNELLPQIEQSLGFSLTLIEDIYAHFEDPQRYPDSYREVMTIEEEMVGTLYSRHAFTDKEGNLLGLNLFACEISDEQVQFLEDGSLAPYFQHLLSLNLGKTQISRFHLGTQYPSITYAAFNECENLQRFTCAKGLKRLARLEITESAISRLQIPEGYERLYYLDISSNPSLTAFRFGGACPNLQVLFLRGNALTEFTLPDGFGELIHLYLNNNKLTKLVLRGQLPKLSTLQLRDNELTEFDEAILGQAPKLDSVFLGKNPLPEELSFRLEDIADQNHIYILKEHFAQRKIGELQPNNECKVLLIGNGKAGKTAIVNRIVNNKFNPKWDSTHGISLFQKELKEYLINYWDFGGQDIYHSTHRLFMQKNAVYILAWSKETEEEFTVHEVIYSDGIREKKKYKNYELRYWLEYAKHLGGGSPMNVVQTKVGRDNPIDKSHLGPPYEDVFQPAIAFHAVESSEEDSFTNGYEDLLAAIHVQVSSLKKGNTTLAEPLYKIREYLRAKQKEGQKLMEYADYVKKAEELCVQKPKEMLETWLFRSGVVYYRPNRFGGQIILDQGWAIEAIYTLFDRSKRVPYEIENRKGIFTGAFVQDIWTTKYPDEDTHRLFIAFMKSCDLCFEIDMGEKEKGFRDRVFMAPQLVRESKPEMIESFWEGKNPIQYRYSDAFIHEGVIHSFISQTAYLAKLIEIWRIGIQLKEGDQYACIEAEKNEIHVRVTDNGGPLLQKIRNLLQALQGEGGKEELLQADGRYTEMNLGRFKGEEAAFAGADARSMAFLREKENKEADPELALHTNADHFEKGKDRVAGQEEKELITRIQVLEQKIEVLSESSSKIKNNPREEERENYEWDAFISHASEDKEEVVLPLGEILEQKGMKIWIDKHEITLGDSLRRKIDEGLASSRFGIVILSEVFFQKEWVKKELDAFIAREEGSEKVILPIWHKVDKSLILKRSPLLGDKIGISTDEGLDAVAEAIFRAYEKELGREGS